MYLPSSAHHQIFIIMMECTSERWPLPLCVLCDLFCSLSSCIVTPTYSSLDITLFCTLHTVLYSSIGTVLIYSILYSSPLHRSSVLHCTVLLPSLRLSFVFHKSPLLILVLLYLYYFSFLFYLLSSMIFSFVLLSTVLIFSVFC